MTNFLKKVAERIKVEGGNTPDLEEEILKNAGDYEKAVNIWSEWLYNDIHQLIQSLTKEDHIKTAAFEDKLLDRCERFASRANDILAGRALQYLEIAKLYLIQIMPKEKRKEREDSALKVQKKLVMTVGLISDYARKLYAEAEANKLHEIRANEELFEFIRKLRDLTFKQMIEGFKQGQVPFLYEIRKK